jgi:hypothetical protein
MVVRCRCAPVSSVCASCVDAPIGHGWPIARVRRPPRTARRSSIGRSRCCPSSSGVAAECSSWRAVSQEHYAPRREFCQLDLGPTDFSRSHSGVLRCPYRVPKTGSTAAMRGRRSGAPRTVERRREAGQITPQKGGRTAGLGSARQACGPRAANRRARRPENAGDSPPPARRRATARQRAAIVRSCRGSRRQGAKRAPARAAGGPGSPPGRSTPPRDRSTPRLRPRRAVSAHTTKAVPSYAAWAPSASAAATPALSMMPKAATTGSAPRVRSGA